MRATNTFRALCLGAALGLTGCITVPRDRDYGRPDRSSDYEADDYGPPPYRPRYDHGGFDHVWYPALGVYTVVGFPAVYWHDGWYWRHHHGGWERCASPRGRHWSRVHWDHVPHRFRGRHADRREDRWASRDEKREERWGRREERREDRHERAELRRDHREERADRRHARREERGEDRSERAEQRRDGRSQRVEARHERRDERRDQRDLRRAEREERRQARAEKREGERAEKREERIAQRH
jgi:hypothetical protein